MNARPPESEALLTPAEVASMFRVDPKTVTRWAKAGKLSSIRTLGGHRRYRESEVRELLSGMMPEQRRGDEMEGRGTHSFGGDLRPPPPRHNQPQGAWRLAVLSLPTSLSRWPGAGSNRRPTDFQSVARTN